MPLPTQTRKQKIFRIGAKLIVPALLMLLVLILAVVNYVPNTWLTGWDNVNQEFNLSLNWDRYFNGVWQENQGVGIPATMAYVSDLPHLAVVQLLTTLGAGNNVRYIYLFICLYLGALGIYSLLSWSMFELRERKNLNVSSAQIRALSFVGAVFFILNLGTLQNFYAPIEMFPTCMAFLPWLFLYIFKYLEHPKAKTLFMFAVITLLATPMAYTPTIFAVYAFALGVICLVKIFTHIPHPKTLFTTIKKIFGLWAVVLLINSFWLLPFTYSFINNASSTVIDAKINQMSSADSYALNQKYGTLENLSLLRGFWFDNVDYKLQDKEFNYMFDEWKTFQQVPIIPLVGYALFIIVLIGIVYSFIVGLPNRFALTLLLILGAIVFLNSNPPFGDLFEFLRTNSPIFREAMRFPFTKISPLLAVLYSVFFGIGALGIVQSAKGLAGLKLTLPLTTVLCALMVIFCFPMFAGHLVYKELQVQIPDNYFAMFKWFDTQPADLRIADLPQPNFWGWNFYDWGYRGSGFVWYGLKQPVLDRAFDVWSNKNEQYYNEVSNAIYNLDFDQLAQIAQKYRIGWFMYDDSINVVLNAEHVKFYQEQFIPLLSKDKRFKLEQNFGDQILVFSYLQNTQNPQPITIAKPTADVQGSDIPANIDNAYANGEYVTTEEPNTAYLLRNQNLTDQMKLSDDGKELIYTADLQLGGQLSLPSYFDTEKYMAVEVSARKVSDRKLEVKLKYLVPEIYQGETKIFPTSDITQIVELPFANYYVGNSYGYIRIQNSSTNSQVFGTIIVNKTGVLNFYNLDQVQRIDLTPSFASVSVGHCSDTKSKLGALVGKDTNGQTINVSAKGAIGCLYVGVEPVFNNNYLLDLQFNYQALTNVLPSICVLQVNINKCINQQLDPNLPKDAKTFYPYSQLLEMPSKLTTASGFQLMVDALNSDITQQLNYRDISVAYFPLEKQVHIDSTLLAKNTKVQTKIGNTTLTVKFPIIATNTLSFEANLKTASEQRVLNCGTKQDGSFESELTDTGALKFTAIDADSCQVFNLPNIPRDGHYIVITNSRHDVGQQAKLCVSNILLQKCAVEYNLSENGDPQLKFVLVNSQITGNGYDIRVSNLSRGRQVTINELSRLRMQFFPSGFLGQIKLFNPVTEFKTTTDLVITDVSHPSSFIYTATIQGNGYLNLNQAADKGWTMLNITSMKSPTKLGEKVELNGWSQGWYVSSDTEVKVLIIYWPQLLEYLGLVVGILTLTKLAIDIPLEKRRKRRALNQES